MAQRPISREYRIYLALWRKATVSAEIVSIRVSSYSMAIAMRQGMYRAIRPFREGTLIDNQLQKAAENFVVYLPKEPDEDGIYWLKLMPRAALAELDSMLGELGLEENDLLLVEEKAVQETLQELLNEPARSTPFYERNE